VLYAEAGRAVRFSGVTKDSPILKITVPTLTKAEIRGAGRFTTHGAITADSFELIVSGAAECTAELDVENATVRLSGAGMIKLSGRADNANLRMSGAGALSAFDLSTKTSEVTMSGAGLMQVNCSEHLKITASGIGTVEHKGGAATDISRSGIVVVTKAG
jgi:hypothetical protein